MTGLLVVKLRRDLRAYRSRFVLMVVAIAVSLTVFGTVLYVWATSGRETERAYLGTEPASATILLDRPIDAERMAAIAAAAARRPGVIAATGRSQFTSEVTVGDRALDSPLQVFVAAPEDAMRVARFEVEQTRWPPAAGEILLDRATLTLLGVGLGDTIVVETPGGEPASLRVAGVVYDPSLAPAPQEQRGHGYVSTQSLARPAVLDQLKLQVADGPGQAVPSRDRRVIEAVAADLGGWLQREHALAIREIQVPEPYEHPHQGQADALLLALLAGGAAALLLSTILVANMLNGLFNQQIPQIGIMKAIGARAGQIGWFYFAMTLSVALAAMLLALAPVILGGRVGTGAVLGFLDIEAGSLAAPWWTYAALLGAGLLLPPLMALVPLVKASRTTVRAAIDHHGQVAHPRAATRALAWVGRIRGLDRGLVMALRNTIRRPGRFLLAVGLLASAGMVFVAGMSLSSGVAAIEQESKDKRRWDVDVQLAAPAPTDEAESLIEELPGVTRVEGWTSAKTGVAGPRDIPTTRTYPDQGHGGVAVIAVSADTAMFDPPKLLEGRWLQRGETGAIVLNQIARAATVRGIGAGETVRLSVGGRFTTWRVVGIVQERGGGSGGTYVTAAGWAEAMGEQPTTNTLRIATDRHDEATRESVAEAVDALLTRAGLDVESADSVAVAEASTEGHLGPIILILLAVAVAMAVVGCIGLASTMSANVLDRTREFGVLHAIGARPKTVRRIVVGEGIFLAVASCLVAVLPTLALTALVGSGLGNLFMDAPLPYRISLPAVGIWVALVVLGAVLATDAAANRASRLSVREALAYL